MRKNRHPLDALIPRTRQPVLAATLMHPARWWHLSDLAKHVGVTPSSLQREVAALVDSGVLKRKREGNRVYYQADTKNPFFPALRRAEARLGREVTVTLYPPHELASKARARSHFVREVLSKEKLFVLGHEDELATIVGGRQRPAAEGLED